MLEIFNIFFTLGLKISVFYTDFGLVTFQVLKWLAAGVWDSTDPEAAKSRDDTYLHFHSPF